MITITIIITTIVKTYNSTSKIFIVLTTKHLHILHKVWKHLFFRCWWQRKKRLLWTTPQWQRWRWRLRRNVIVITYWRWIRLRRMSNELREIKLGFVSFELQSSFIISSSCSFSSFKCAKPYSCSFSRISYFSCPFSPWSVPNSSIMFFLFITFESFYI